MKIQMIDDNNYILTFEKVTLNDSGSYTVEIENEAGKAKSSGEVCHFKCMRFVSILILF